MSKTEIPSIRFRGFDDAWEQRKLGEVATFINGRAYSQPELLSSGKYKVLRVGNFYTNDSWYYSDLELGEKYYADYGDLLYTWSATFGPHIWLGDRAIYHYHIWKINLSDQLEKQFAVQLLEQDRANILSSKNGSTMVHITKEGMEQKDVIISPNTKEQQEIGAFFLQLDNLITLHQRKFEKLTNVKKSMLEKMFPRNGSCYPEIRFKGFTDPWEQRKLGELVDRVVRKNTNNESTLPLTISAQYGLVDQITYFNNRVASRNVSNYYLVLNGEFAYNKSTSDGYPFGAVKRLDLYEKGVLSTLYIVFAPKKEQQIDSDYLTVFFDTDRWHKGVAERAAEGARNHGLLNISAEDFFDIDLSVPKDIVEQKQIGAFIRQLDNLITLHQRELEKLQSIKKALLEKMFV